MSLKNILQTTFYICQMSLLTCKKSMEVHQDFAEPWKVTLVDTGEDAMTGGRLKRVADYIQGEEEFCFTYGDGVADINIGASIEFHRK